MAYHRIRGISNSRSIKKMAAIYIWKQSHCIYRSWGKLYRWAVYLSSFNLTIIYIKGTMNVDADYLSRHPKVEEAMEHADQIIKLQSTDQNGTAQSSRSSPETMSSRCPDPSFLLPKTRALKVEDIDMTKKHRNLLINEFNVYPFTSSPDIETLLNEDVLMKEYSQFYPMGGKRAKEYLKMLTERLEALKQTNFKTIQIFTPVGYLDHCPQLPARYIKNDKIYVAVYKLELPNIQEIHDKIINFYKLLNQTRAADVNIKKIRSWNQARQSLYI
eukprot:NODE_753_length_4211_cov_0.739543.p3 type:complete len:273 gc:universal NODE_753_length_4211_cov_0.739543:2960-2142(-)